MSIPVTFRVATAADVSVLIDLMVISSWGGMRTAWMRAKSHHQTWQERGHAELTDAACEIGYPRFVVADLDGRIAGMVLFNVIGNTDDIKPKLALPEQEGALTLIKEARDSLFIRELAMADWARGQGLASEFLDLAERVCASNKLSRVTLIVNDANGPAHKLYLKQGYVAVEHVPSIGHPTFEDGSMLLLMQKLVG
jgi:ribosomal protein S18 acetylase RimI-like enzyme